MITYMEVYTSVVLSYPSNNDVWSRHLSIGRHAKTHPARTADVHCKVDRLCGDAEVPMESIVLAFCVKQGPIEWVFGLEISLVCSRACAGTEQRMCNENQKQSWGLHFSAQRWANCLLWLQTFDSILWREYIHRCQKSKFMQFCSCLLTETIERQRIFHFYILAIHRKFTV